MKKIFAFTLLSALFFVACSSVPKEIPESLTAQELIQLGQSNFESGNYKAALAYYNTTIERYADFPSFYIEARYEIGHLYMKQKKYKLASTVFTEIKEIYSKNAPGTLPAAFKKLAEIELAKIPE